MKRRRHNASTRRLGSAIAAAVGSAAYGTYQRRSAPHAVPFKHRHTQVLEILSEIKEQIIFALDFAQTRVQVEIESARRETIIVIIIIIVFA